MGIDDEYKAMMDHLDPPEYLNEKVVKTVDSLREGGLTGARPRVCGRKQTKRKAGKQYPRLLPSIALGSIAASLLVGAVLAIPSVLAGHETDSISQKSSDQAVSNMFGLALYADASETEQFAYIATGESGISPHGGSGGPRPSALQYLINLKCVGENIDTVTYAIEGEDVRFELIEMQDIEGDDELHPKTYTYPQELTVDYEEQHSDYYIQRIEVDTRTAEEREFDFLELYSELEKQLIETEDPEEQARIENEISKLSEEQTRRNRESYAGIPEDPDERVKVLDEFYRSASLEAAQKIGQATLSVTATFFDGSTATKQYKITPVENLEQVMDNRDNAITECAGNTELLDADPRMTAPLFTITEIS